MHICIYIYFLIGTPHTHTQTYVTHVPAKVKRVWVCAPSRISCGGEEALSSLVYLCEGAFRPALPRDSTDKGTGRIAESGN